MSKVILKIGPNTRMVPQENIQVIRYGQAPVTTIKYAKDHSVVFFERNPFYVTITEPSEVGQICSFLDDATRFENEARVAKKEGNMERYDELMKSHRTHIAMASMNIESTVGSYINSNLFETFGTSIVKALRMAKKMGYEAAERNLQSTQA